MAKKQVMETISTVAMARLGELSLKREAWERDQFARTNQALYELLTECMQVYLEIKGTTAEATVMSQMKAELVNIGIVTKVSTPILTVIVRYVFKNDRRRAHSYSRALRVATLERIEANKFTEWVIQQGGIEEVVRTKALTQETLLKRANLDSYCDQVRHLLASQLAMPLGIVPKSALQGNAVDTGEYTLLIGKTMANGETKVLSVVPKATESMIKAAVKQTALALMDTVIRTQQEKAQQDAESAAKFAANSAVLLEAA